MGIEVWAVRSLSEMLRENLAYIIILQRSDFDLLISEVILSNNSFPDRSLDFPLEALKRQPRTIKHIQKHNTKSINSLLPSSGK